MVEHEHESGETAPAEDDEALQDALSEASDDVAKTPGDDEDGPTANEATEDT